MRITIWMLILLALPHLLGCGYTPGYRLPRGVQRISIPIFRNETIPFRREIEFSLTRAVKREFQLRTTADLVAQEDADAVLYGTVLHFREGVLVESANGTIQEQGIGVRVSLRLERVRDQRVLIERVVEDLVSYSVPAGESVELAMEEAVQEIARRLIAELEPWYEQSR
ncbi:MAG: LptE family protein [Planctomycetota bacterium]|nr:LptE family protein [Planctomycetota bacterium]